MAEQTHTDIVTQFLYDLKFVIENEDEPKYDNDVKNEECAKNQDGLKHENYLENGDDPKNETFQKNEDNLQSRHIFTLPGVSWVCKWVGEWPESPE